MRAVVLGVAIAAAVVACGAKATPPSDPGGAGSGSAPPYAADRSACTTAGECTLVEACCGCNAGGRRVAIRKDAVADYDVTRDQRCHDTTCAQMISQDASCDAEAGCEGGRCVVLPHMGG